MENKHGKGKEGNIWRGKYLLAHEMEKERNMFRRKTFFLWKRRRLEKEWEGNIQIRKMSF